jgi:preprotein translocase subunit SecB
VSAGGFPPLLLQPINFDALYNRSISQGEVPDKNIKVH